MNVAVNKKIDIEVRRVDFEFKDNIPEFWYDNDPFLTLFLTALSATFPEGEKQFIQAVRNYQGEITDPVLMKQIRAFIGQEAHHSKEHDALNDLMKRKGYPVLRIEKRMAKMAKWMRSNWSKERQLANTICAEHLTAIIADYFMTKSPEELDKIHEGVRAIWAWHIIEETEHKAVAFDVYKQTVNDDTLRRTQMVLLTVLFLLETGVSTVQLLRESGRMGDMKMWFKATKYFLGPKGMMVRLLPDYLTFYKKDFHPWDHDNRTYLKGMIDQYITS